jgi:hypothetical protein
MNFNFSFLVAAALLLACSNALNWQGAGTWGNGNITTINDYINSNFFKFWGMSALVTQDETTLSNFATGFATYLNGQWDPAWNVVVVVLPDSTNSDSVVYGYAFRDHWMWINGFQMDDGTFVSFIIWKDYNCNGWATINSNRLVSN